MVSLELTTTPRTLMVVTLSAPLINGSKWSKATDERLLNTINSFVFVALSFRLFSSAHREMFSWLLRAWSMVIMPMICDFNGKKASSDSEERSVSAGSRHLHRSPPRQQKFRAMNGAHLASPI